MPLCEQLREFLASGPAPVLFAGAGVSARAGLPTWGKYLNELSEVARKYDTLSRQIMKERLAEGLFVEAADYYFATSKIPQAEKMQSLAGLLEGYTAAVLQPLVSIPLSAIVTTNYDRAILDAFAAAHSTAAPEVNLNDPTLRAAQYNEKFYVARIHGRVEVPADMVLSSGQYKNLETNAAYADFLTHIFTRCRVLFVGFSFLDPAIRIVLDTIEKSVGAVHAGRHMALLPEDSSSEFTKELAKFSIHHVAYSSIDDHSELWQCFADISAQTHASPESVVTPQSVEHPLGPAVRYLASCYARLRLGRGVSPLRATVVEGMVGHLLMECDDRGGIEPAVLSTKIHQQLSIPLDAATTLVREALRALHTDGLCKISSAGGGRGYVWTGGDEHSYDSALAELVDGGIDRYVVREGGKDSPQARSCLLELLRALILRRGWDLGAGFSSNRPPESIDVHSVASEVVECDRESISLFRACEHMLTRPSSSEARLLADLGRLSFAVELVAQSPHDTLLHSSTLPQRIYLDANVLMPAVTEGHPYHDVYKTTIERLVQASTAATSTVSIVAYAGFLNEVVSHRRLAIDELAGEDAQDHERLARDAALFGTTNLNVFVGAYATLCRQGYTGSFGDFLTKYAPYDNEQQLKQWLESKGLVVMREAELPRVEGEYADILGALERAYSDEKPWFMKSARLVQHDAAQLAALNADVKKGLRAIFVSADRRLRDMTGKGAYSHLANHMVSSVGLAQLIDLLVGNPVDVRGLARMLWSTRISEASEQVRQYFVDLALRTYDDAVAMSMGDVIDEIVEDAVFKMERDGLQVQPDTAEEKARLRAVMEEFEDRFFAGMREVIEKRRDRN